MLFTCFFIIALIHFNIPFPWLEKIHLLLEKPQIYDALLACEEAGDSAVKARDDSHGARAPILPPAPSQGTRATFRL